MTIDYDIAYKTCAKVVEENELYYPLDVWQLISNYGLKAVSYTKISEKNNCSFEDFTDISEFGFLLREKNTSRAIIYYNDKQNDGTIRFTFVHELGHFLMDHFEDTKTNENLANCFARNLIAPVSICNTLSLTTSSKITEYFNISNKAGIVRADFLYLDYIHIKKLAFHPTLHYKPIVYI